MGITSSNKEISVPQIDCGGCFQIKLSLSAAPSIVSDPTDIVLILDRSGSMKGTPLESLKKGADKFIDIIDEATDGAQDGQIGSGSRIGIVSFAGSATQDTQLITSVADLKTAVNALTADGSTNHEDAFTKALELFDPASSNAKVMVMFTDGETTAGGDANVVATAAKAQGVIIYCIGLIGEGGIDEQALRDWASDPDSAYVSIAPDEAALEKIFEDLANNITKPGATNVVISDTVASCFRIKALSSPSKGTACMINSNTVEWKIDELGTTQIEGAVFEFTVEHIGPCSGTVEVNEKIEYDDDNDSTVDFPSPTIEVECDIDIFPEPCPEATDMCVDSCTDSVEFDACDVALQSLGRIVQVDVNLKKVCPYKRVALAVLLYEVDHLGNEHKRGMKVITVPAHTRSSCRDVTVRCIKFVLPEDLDVSGTTDSICGNRNLRVKVLANYIDNDFECCNDEP